MIRPRVGAVGENALARPRDPARRHGPRRRLGGGVGAAKPSPASTTMRVVAVADAAWAGRFVPSAQFSHQVTRGRRRARPAPGPAPRWRRARRRPARGGAAHSGDPPRLGRPAVLPPRRGSARASRASRCGWSCPGPSPGRPSRAAAKVGASVKDSVTSQPSSAAADDVVAPELSGLSGAPTPKAKVRARLALRHRAGRPVDRALAVALDVAPEARPDGRAGGARRSTPPRRSRGCSCRCGSRRCTSDPDPFGRGRHVDGHRVVHRARPPSTASRESRERKTIPVRGLGLK